MGTDPLLVGRLAFMQNLVHVEELPEDNPLYYGDDLHDSGDPQSELLDTVN
nr:hypothetical protein [uncultured Bacillus sp.]